MAAVIAVLWGGAAATPPRTVRLALVNVPDDVVRPMLPIFTADTGIAATIVYTGRDPFGEAREGRADLVIAHYGHEGVEPFVTGGFGLWPHPVFSNQMTLLGPPSDPARVRGLTDVAEALKRIAQSRSRFVVNNSTGARYLEEISAIEAKLPRTGAWYVDKKLEGPEAARAASQQGAYVIWGLPPFLRLKRQEALALEPLVVAAPLFQRIMVSVVANPATVKGVNAEAAKSFDRFLLSPKTQAWIQAFRYPDFAQQAWWPAGRHNSARE